uniref:Cytochrome c biogenesis protein CcsA n=1 Tax=Xylochloris irregularis TaxID=480381 RepID=A0A097KM97_9CHLO|nr:heme attachment to plastid cytochrome c [Xylochloris irregularis]AIT94290.1 heme attachment to plastid cytochrome c [Xylochloris irregularis]
MVQAVLGNSCFVLLFFAMLLYWSEAWLLCLFEGFAQPLQLGALGMKVSNLLLLCLLLFRWEENGHYPLSNLYESLIFLTWSITLATLLLEKVYGMTIIGAILSPLALLTLGFADFSLPKQLQESTTLVPALRSNWLVMHVTVMMFSYAALLIGCLFSITYLVFSYQAAEKDHPSRIDAGVNQGSFLLPKKDILTVDQADLSMNGTIPSQPGSHSILKRGVEGLSLKSNENKMFPNRLSQSALSPLQLNDLIKPDEGGSNCRNESLDQLKVALDNLSYRTIGLGFSFLTIGILSGAVWANEAWGSYWSWDPKETWALVTWITFAIYLHTRITRGWGGNKSAIIATFGFLVVWVCFLGVNLFAKGLHSYGWVT